MTNPMTKTIIAALLATLALAIASPTAADDTTTGYFPGDWLMRACQSEETSYIAYCTGYAAGVLEAYGCLTPIGLRFILVDWLKSNPQQSHRPARDLVLLAFKEHKDCGAPKGATR
jgi:Rap1a immunity proteins